MPANSFQYLDLIYIMDYFERELEELLTTVVIIFQVAVISNINYRN